MSTKTSIKRVALIAVSALGFGLMSVVPAKAGAVTASITDASDVTPLGVAATTAVSFDNTAAGDTITLTLTVPTGSAVTLTDNNGAVAGTDDIYVSADAGVTFDPATGIADDADADAGNGDITITPDVAGVYTVTLTGTGTSTGVTADTYTITAGDLWGEVADGLSNGDQTNTSIKGVAGDFNTVTLSFHTKVRSQLITVTGSTVDAFTAGTNATAVIADDKKSLVVTDADTAETVLIKVKTPAAGTITVKSFLASQGGIYSTTAYGSVTITVNSAAVTNVYSAADTTVYAAAGTLSSGLNGDAGGTTPSSTTDAAVLATTPIANAANAATVEALKIVVDQNDGAGNNLASGFKANTVSISPIGSVGVAAGTPLGNYAAETAQDSDFYVFADGRSGTATVTVSVNGVTTATYKVIFAGALASYSVTYTAPATALKSHLGVGETEELTVSGKDANLNAAVSLGTVYASSSDTTKATVSVAGAVVTVTGVAAGSATITIGNASGSAATITKTVAYTVTKTTAKSFTLTWDKETYLPGEKMTLTLTATDSNGSPVADGSRNLFSSAGITSNVSLVGATWSAAAAVVVAGGKKTWTAFAPLVSGTVTVSATEGASVDAVAAGGTAAVISASATVGQTAAEAAADAATEAAVEATDAANQAYEAAVVATETAEAAVAAAEDAKAAADAATAAVEALATQVSTMMADLKAQVTALAKTVAKILKRV